MLRNHQRIFEYIRGRYYKIFEGATTNNKPIAAVNFQKEIKKYIDSINYLNHLVCGGVLTEIKALENTTTEEYYSTLHTWLTINEDKRKANQPKERRALTSDSNKTL